MLDDIESYLSKVDFEWFVETHYRDYICLDPVKDKIQTRAVSQNRVSQQGGAKNQQKYDANNMGCSLIIFLVVMVSSLICFML